MRLVFNKLITTTVTQSHKLTLKVLYNNYTIISGGTIPGYSTLLRDNRNNKLYIKRVVNTSARLYMATENDELLTNKFENDTKAPEATTIADVENGDVSDKKAQKELKKKLDKEAKQKKFEEKKAKQINETKTPKQKKGPEVIEYKWNHKAGEKKDTKSPLPQSYSPKYVEAAWNEWWEKCGFFRPEYGRESVNASNHNGTFMLCIPPPNVTGNLHLGHALTISIEDVLVRWNRSKGKTTLWNPGCDHAGIATQVVIEKKLMKERNISRHKLGRENFLKEVWKWKDEKGDHIYDQMKYLGASCDWSRACFTMDPKLSNAVTEAFIRLHRDKLIYRANRLVNWSCNLCSAISNIEVDKKELEGRTLMRIPGYAEPIEFGLLVSFAYPIEGGGEIVVATTRPETMLGDSAIAVHPEDSRFSDVIGKICLHPFVDRKLRIIADQAIDREFGTGAVKVTPAHDTNDYELGLKHNLDYIEVINDEGIMTPICGERFAKMKRFDCRKAVINALKENGLYRETKEHKMVVPICSRSKDVIEPLLKPQWYVNCEEMSKSACNVVREGKLKIVPNFHEKTWFQWLDNCRDWCISRQLWWGHRIPAYFVTLQSKQLAENSDNDYWVSARSEEEAKKLAADRFNVNQSEVSVSQDEDVLDTWFSSALFPFSIFGWPDVKDNIDFNQFYPGSILETGHDILFFWVARMVMFGLKLVGDIPFKEVYLHAMVRDSHGRKMSKSLGNIIDPMDVIRGIALEELHEQLEKGNLDPREITKARDGQKQDFPDGIPECGSDALRFGLMAYTLQGRDINLDINRVAAYRNFCNKMWNAMNFTRSKLGDNFTPYPEQAITYSLLKGDDFHSWIMSRLAETVEQVDGGIEKYNFPQATTALYDFWLYNFCDVYLEAIKPVMATMEGEKMEEKNTVKQVLYTCSDVALRLFSLFMPFISEELYQRLPRRKPDTDPPSICVTPFPDSMPIRNPPLDKNISDLLVILHLIRSLKTKYLHPKMRPEIIIQTQDPKIETLINFYMSDILTLAQIDKIIFSSSTDPPEGCVMVPMVENGAIFLQVKGFIDIPQEVEKLNKQKEKTTILLNALLDKMGVADYATKVPKEVVEANEFKRAKLEGDIAEVNKVITSLLGAAK